MNYIINKVSYEIINNASSLPVSIITKNIVNKELLVYDYNINQNNTILDILTPKYTKFKIKAYIGKGTTGQVYLLESVDNETKYAIKISNDDYDEHLIDEIKLINYYFSKYKVYVISKFDYHD